MISHFAWIFFLGKSSGWSAPSHRLIAIEAALKLSSDALNYMSSVLAEYLPNDGKSLRIRVGAAMADVSPWADKIEETSDYHFSHTLYPSCASFDESRDCPNGRCLVTGLRRYMNQAISPKNEAERTEALKYLIHLIGDATQPLHTGFKKDAGGMGVHLASPRAVSLHVYWDFDFLEAMQADDPKGHILNYALDDGDLLSKDEIASGGFAAKIVSETASKLTCEKAYKDDSGEWITDTLTNEYISDRKRVVKKQLKKSAVYISQIIEFLADKWTTKKSETSVPRALPKVLEQPLLRNSNRFITLDADLLPPESSEDSIEQLKGELRRKPNKKHEILGRDLSDLTTKTINGAIFIVLKELIENNDQYVPENVHQFEVYFGTVLKHVFVDNDVFPDLTVNTNHLGNIFRYLRGKELIDEEGDVAMSRGLNRRDWKEPMLQRARRFQITISEGGFVPPPPARDRAFRWQDDTVVVRTPQVLAAIDLGELGKPNMMFHIELVLAKQQGNLEPIIIITSASLEAFVEPGIPEKFDHLSGDPRNTARVTQLQYTHSHVLDSILQLASLAFGESQTNSRPIKEIRMLKKLGATKTTTIEIIMNPVERRNLLSGPDDLLLFEIGKTGIGMTATPLMSSNEDIEFSHQKIAGYDVFVDVRLVKPVNLEELITLAVKRGYPFATRLDPVMTRQALALKEFQLLMRNQPVNRRHLAGYPKRKDGEPLKILLKVNHRKK